MSIRGFANGLSKMVQNATNAIVGSKIIPNMATGAYNKIVKPIGKAAFNTTLKTGAAATQAAAGVVQNQAKIKKVGKAVFNGTKTVGANVGMGIIHEGSAFAQAGINAAIGLGKGLEKMGLVKEVPLDKSLIGWKLTGTGKTALFAGAFAVNAVSSSKDYLTEGRTGRNDGQLYRLTPQMVNPYEISQQMASSPSIGNAYANNAGATGDLVFALDKLNK